jgi:3-phytase
MPGLALTLLAAILGQAAAPPVPEGALRVATFNASLNREAAGDLLRDLATPDNPQARNVAEVIQRIRPDILLVNEFDFDSADQAIALFQKNYLGVSQNGSVPITYAHHFTPETNTGEATGVDIDNDGQVVREPGTRGYGNDAQGYGAFPGQYGMVVLSRFPIDTEQVAEFRKLRWRDMPGAALPTRPDGTPWYSPAALDALRISSKNHVDVPVRVDGRVLHLLVSHPTPPAFDGPEDRNGRRNHDEIRLWADYLTGGERAGYLGRSLPPDAPFVILGDLNADPHDGGSYQQAIGQLLQHPRVDARVIPRSVGAEAAARDQGGANATHRGPHAEDTADFNDRAVGNLRADYVLPSRGLEVAGSGVFWPAPVNPLARLVAMDPAATSDHRLVYVDLRLPAAR